MADNYFLISCAEDISNQDFHERKINHMEIVFHPLYISKRKLKANLALKPKMNNVYTCSSLTYFQKKHCTNYLSLLADHFRYKQKKLKAG